MRIKFKNKYEGRMNGLKGNRRLRSLLELNSLKRKGEKFKNQNQKSVEDAAYGFTGKVWGSEWYWCINYT